MKTEFTPSACQIDLWCGRASAAEPGPLEACCEASLCDEERRHAARFRRPTTRNQHVVGRGMARTLLAGNSLSPQQIEFSLNSHGKPDVVAPLAAKRPFNIAHTEGMVVFASCTAGRIGVDVERLSRSTNVSVAERYFATTEVDYVFSHTDVDDQRFAFLRVWTLKESFIKAIGKGLAIPLGDFAFADIDSPTPTIRILREELGHGSDWRFACVEPATGYVAAVAVNEINVESIDVQVRDFHSLLGLV